VTTAREVFAGFEDYVLGRGDDMWAPDIVFELPFAAGGPSRIEGADHFRELTKASRESLPVRFEEVRDVVVHETTDPDKIVVEYTLAGVLTTTNTEASASFIAVMVVRDGRIVRWREYQNTLAMVEALGRPQTTVPRQR
jgi:ketosteroid isomerase-like protein